MTSFEKLLLVLGATLVFGFCLLGALGIKTQVVEDRQAAEAAEIAILTSLRNHAPDEIVTLRVTTGETIDFASLPTITVVSVGRAGKHWHTIVVSGARKDIADFREKYGGQLERGGR